MQTRTKESRKRLQSLILLTAFTCVLLIVSTYAWFTTQKDVNVSNVRAKVEVAEGLSISLDGDEWTQTLDLGNALDPTHDDYQMANASLTERTDDFEYIPYEGHRNHVPDEFLPVSTSGDIIDVTAGGTEGRRGAKELGFYTGKYDGNTTQDFDQIIKTNEDDASLLPSDSAYAGYYAFDIFLKNTSKTGVTKDILQLNSDAFAWVLPGGENGETITNSANIKYYGKPDPGIQNAIRVAFARYGDGETGGSNQYVDSTQVENTLNDVIIPTAGYPITKVAIWEPNHDDHKTRILNNIGKLFPTGTNPLPVLAEGQTDYDRTSYTPFWVHTLKSTAVSQTIENVFDWSNTHMQKTPTLQTTTTYGTEDDKLNGFTVEGVQNLITTDSTAANPSETGDAKYDVMTLAANSITRFRVYVYIEGQDPDCDTDASQGGGIEVSIALTKGEAQGSMDRYNELYTGEGTTDDRAAYTGGSVTGTTNPVVAGS